MKSTNKQFKIYENIRKSGIVNMLDIKAVQELSGLSKDIIIDITKHYHEYQEPPKSQRPLSVQELQSDDILLMITLIRELFNNLEPRDRFIIENRLGIRIINKLPYHIIGDRLNVSKQRIHQLYNKALDYIDKNLTNPF